MFAYLFSWTDTAWLHRRKIKMFRFTPSPVSSASVFWWCGKGGFADRKCTLDDSLDRWYDDRFPPLSIYYGGKDYLVLTEPLLERLEKKEKIKPIRVEKLADHEVGWFAVSSIIAPLNPDAFPFDQHCDMMWHMEAVELVFGSLRRESYRTCLFARR
jgi:lysosomal acid lipase/cholesteryl ester hydrolase